MKKQVLKRYHQLKRETDLKRKYPEMKLNDGKVHLLYLHCLINSSGLYRIILPAIELNRCATHAAVIANMHKWDFTKQFSDYDNAVEKELIEWADFIILPMVDLDLTPIQEEFAQINPNLRWVMDVDELPNKKPEQLQLLANNLNLMQMISAPTPSMADFLETLLDEQPSGENQTAVAVIPNLIAQDLFLRLPARQADKAHSFRLGICGTPVIAKQITAISDAIYQALKGKEQKAKLVLLGWNGKHQKEAVFKDLPLECHKAVSILDYYEKVHDLNLDAAILPPPAEPKPNRQSSIKYIELSALGIPVIADSKSVYNRLIVDGETGFIASSKADWKQKIEQLIQGQLSHREVGQYAQKFSWRNFSWNRLKAAQLSATYHPIEH